ncbi:hypothetical protein AAG570_007204 [Ranatra chinensis]|uniref:Syntaxin-16 n=1 Tax=Ranatra chinensis TaxID=642074 RepID=A0ABD0Y8B1_9HEMI
MRGKGSYPRGYPLSQPDRHPIRNPFPRVWQDVLPFRMVTRSLTEVYVLMRNNAIQNRHIYSDQRTNDRVALVADQDEDVELANLPPTWTSNVEETQYIAVRLKSKLSTLSELHSKAISRPTLDDTASEEQQIDALTQEISRMFNSAHRLVAQIRAEGSYAGSGRERRLAESVASALVTTLQSLSIEFRTMQNGYLTKLNLREERSKAYFDVDLNAGGGGSLSEDLVLPSRQGESWQHQSLMTVAADPGATGDGRVDSFQQLLQLEANTKEICTREAEVERIVRSIVDLNDLFKDIGQIVVDQVSAY